jgi:CTP synthase (UTP-ammonia lyase)
MSRCLSIVLDSPPTAPYHVATVKAVVHAVEAENVELEMRVVRTPDINAAFLARPGDAVLIGPGSPYDVPLATDELIRTARERGLPLVGT